MSLFFMGTFFIDNNFVFLLISEVQIRAFQNTTKRISSLDWRKIRNDGKSIVAIATCYVKTHPSSQITQVKFIQSTTFVKIQLYLNHFSEESRFLENQQLQLVRRYFQNSSSHSSFFSINKIVSTTSQWCGP